MVPIGLIILISIVLVILFGPPDWAATGMVAGVLYLTLGQQIDIAGINFYAVRFIEVAGFIRIVLRGELRRIQFNEIDKSFFAFQIIYLLAFSIYLLFDTYTSEKWIGRFSFFCDGILCYFIFRSLFSGPEVFIKFIKKCAYLIVPFAAFMYTEGRTGHDAFAFMGVPRPLDPHMRNEGYRAQASFGVSITAGCFGATMLPLFIASLFSRKTRYWGIIGAAACVLITLESRSGTPLLSLATATFGWLCWRVRGNIKLIRRGIIVITIIILMMTSSMAFITGQLTNATGGHVLDRVQDIENFIGHFGDWWLIGMSPEKMSSWDVARLLGGRIDMLNEFASVGIGGGLISLMLFIRLILKCFKSLEDRLELLSTPEATNKKDELLLWGVGSALFGHIAAISGSTYWDQMYVMWYMILGLAAGLSAYYLNAPQPEREQVTHSENIPWPVTCEWTAIPASNVTYVLFETEFTKMQPY